MTDHRVTDDRVTDDSVTRAHFDEVFARCDNRGRWGADDERGALNLIGPEQIVAAAGLVRSGRTVSCAWDLDTETGPDNPSPVEYRVVFGFDDPDGDLGDLRIAGDGFAMDAHGDAHSHLDALCHVGFAARTYNGLPLTEAMGPHGGRRQTVLQAADGIVTRGVLLDLPRQRGVDWIEPGEAIGPDEVLAAERATGTELRQGDLVLLRTGHSHRRRTLGPWDAANAKAGLHVDVLPVLAERDIAGVGYDGDGEAVPSRCEDVVYPIHAISLPALGWWTMDSLDLDGVAAACATEQRWEFLLTIAPLRLVGGTGSPVNPIAVF